MGGVPDFLGGVPGFLGVFRIFGRVFLVFLGVFRVLGGVPGFWVFRDVLGCCGVPVFRVPVFLEVLHAVQNARDKMRKGMRLFRLLLHEAGGDTHLGA